MARVRIKWNRPAFEQVRRSPEVDAALGRAVNGVLSDVGHEGYEGGVESGRTRSRGYVVTTTGETVRAEAEEHTLLRALGRASL